MWLSKKLSVHQQVEQEGTAADMGVITIGGDRVSVMARGEQRELEVFGPRGILWRPDAGDTVLVIKGGIGAQEQCVVGAAPDGSGPENMLPGELYLFSAGGASIYLGRDGTVQIQGDVTVYGDMFVHGDAFFKGQVSIDGGLSVNGEPYRPCTCTTEKE